MLMSSRAAVWVLLGPHRGDNNQVLALADAIGLPSRTIEMRYKRFGHLPAVCRSATISQLEPEVRREITPPWPSLVLGIGQRSAPVARYIQRESGDLTKIVRLGDPMVSHRLFDLVITTTQYAVRDADNVIRLPITITNPKVLPNDEEEQWLERFAQPRRLLVIGGKTSLWRFGNDVVLDAATQLKGRAEIEGGSVIAVTSPRTSPALIGAARAALGDEALVTGPFPRYGALLDATDEIHVTGDSVSMLSDAVASGKPVGLIPLEPDRIQKFVRFVGELRGKPFRMRELDKFWTDLRARGLVGTVDEPRCGALEVSPLHTAVEAVLNLEQTSVPLLQAAERIAPLPSTPEPFAL